MRSPLIIILAIALASVGLISATSDESILLFAIVDEYPERFTKLDFRLFDSSGEKLLGEMHIFA